MIKNISLVCWGILSLYLSVVKAQQLQVSLTVDNTRFYEGDEISLRVNIRGEADIRDVEIKGLDNFEVLGRNISQSINIINWKKVVSKSFIYQIIPKGTGTFVVGPAVINYKGRRYQSNVVNLSILKEAQSGNAPQQRPYKIEAFVSNKKPYFNEQVVYTIRISTRIELGGTYSPPKIEGFWKEDLGKKRTYTKVINGVEWNITEIKMALFPTKRGELTIPSATLNGEIRARGRRNSYGRNSPFGFDFDSFFDRQEVKRVRLRTKPITLIVRDLPPYMGRGNFSGLVGDFSLESSLNKNNLKVGGSSTLSIEVKGKGNIFDAKIPKLDFPQFKTYEDKPQLNKQASQAGILGSKLFKMALIPQEEGPQTIPSISIVYFDPKNEIYKEAKSLPISLNVLKSEEKENLNVVSGSQGLSTSKKEIKVEGKDIFPIILNAEKKTRGKISPLESAMGLALFGLFPLLFAGARFKKSRSNLSDQDIALAKREKALKNFGKSMGQINGSTDFTSEASQVFRTFLGDKVNCDGKSITSYDLDRLFGPYNVDQKTLDEARLLLQSFEGSQYGGGQVLPRKEMEEKMKNLAKSLDRELK